MRRLDIALVNQSVSQSRVNLFMSEQDLYLLDRHPLVNRLRCQRPSEFMGMHAPDAKVSPELSQKGFDSTDLQPVVGVFVRNKQRVIGIVTGVQVLLNMEFRFRVKIDNTLLVPLPSHNALHPRRIDCGAV